MSKNFKLYVINCKQDKLRTGEFVVSGVFTKKKTVKKIIFRELNFYEQFTWSLKDAIETVVVMKSIP